ncbi:vWA domain-containing protein [Paraliomyxa miuraensis]|uniref:hypothetical protein n=1 Tax=Paraliomyxa miuraensis TaxID=376150 RepID=UPI0022590CD7|nr:hypothetical protein [Paraliomyxa miuraensis]MCX4244890.1 hypothetical protein [Paraliomyxa miuraensis]
MALSVGVAALLLGGPLACTAGGNDDGFDFSTDSNGPGGPGTGSGTVDDTAGSGTDTTSGGTAADAGSTTGSGTDDGSSSDDGLPIEPCTSVDILFVVDNSQPMLEEQIRLRAAALAFVQQIGASIPTLMSDMHIGVITTDDELMVQQTAEVCGPYEGGDNWMASSSTTLSAELDCALAVGVAGSPNERPMDMLFSALSDENLVPGAFHNGFLREEALLVVVIVTNEEDEHELDTSWGSAGEPADWVDTLAGRKGGYAKDVVVLSLIGTDKPNACPDFQWDGTEGAQLSPRLEEFTTSFPQGAVGDICAQEYATFMLGVVPGVTSACANFTKP